MGDFVLDVVCHQFLQHSWGKNMRHIMIAILVALTLFAAPGQLQTATAQTQTVCLEVWRDNTFSGWKNTCDFSVYVNWTDNSSCANYGCADTVPPHARVPATITRKGATEWCEFHRGKTGNCRTAGRAATSSSNAENGGGAVQFGGAAAPAAITAAQRKAYGRCAGNAETEALFDAAYDQIGGMTGGRDIAGFNEAVQFIVYGAGARDPAKWQRYEALVNRCL